MIVDHVNKFIIATPTKCGTTTLENLARSRGGRLGLSTVRPRQHRMIVPEELDRYQRYLAVRNPYDRLVSIYLYLSNPSNYSQWGHNEVKDRTFPEFVQWWVKQRIKHGIDDDLYYQEWRDLKWWRSPNLWLVSLNECYEMLLPDGIVRLENLEPDLKALRDDWGGAMLHSNRSTNRQKDSRRYYTRKTIQVVNDVFARRDCAVLGYDLMEG